MKHINITHLIAAALAALLLFCMAHNFALRNELAEAHTESEELSDRLELTEAAMEVMIAVPAAPFYWDETVTEHDPTIFRVDVLHNILSQSHGVEFADMMVSIIRTHPANGEAFTPLWDEDLIDRGIMPLGWEG